MPQESAGCAGVRKPALVLLLGLVLLLLAHAVACAGHLADGHAHDLHVQGVPVAAPVAPEEAGAAVLRSVREAAEDLGPGHGAGEHPGHGSVCCDPADLPAGPRATAGAVLLAFALLALLFVRQRPVDPAPPGAPPGRAGPEPVGSPCGSHLLHLVCVSRT
ncbi:hypothetical protein AB0C13_23140 [Streptomyces sp. NPDC049099]|uniref:hypothetical protein n=1 Tax=Streptomyces sp. NPDC049099 TaxID=3155768 RepID=UPI003431C8EA